MTAVKRINVGETLCDAQVKRVVITHAYASLVADGYYDSVVQYFTVWFVVRGSYSAATARCPGCLDGVLTYRWHFAVMENRAASMASAPRLVITMQIETLQRFAEEAIIGLRLLPDWRGHLRSKRLLRSISIIQ